MTTLISFLDHLERSSISYSLEHNRPGAIMVLVATPGERWEVEFFEDGTEEVEGFSSTGVEDARSLDSLFRRFSR